LELQIAEFEIGEHERVALPGDPLQGVDLVDLTGREAELLDRSH
jgi:hypothetical protein